MVNLVQAFAEEYARVQPSVSVQVGGGGSGVGIAGLIQGIVDIAAAGREIKPDERRRAAARTGADPQEFTVALDALAVYVNAANPVDHLSFEDLAAIYGEEGAVHKWSQLGAQNEACRRDEIVRVSRQNNSGTYVYFRDVVLGRAHDYKLGSIDQSGSKDVVALVSRTPCAIGYSGMAFATRGAKTIAIARTGAPAALPTADAVLTGSYPLARALYFYTPGEPPAHVGAFIEWVRGPEGQGIVRRVGFVPVAADARVRIQPERVAEAE
jgi:phosphate transport system substrate-binding protein